MQVRRLCLRYTKKTDSTVHCMANGREEGRERERERSDRGPPLRAHQPAPAERGEAAAGKLAARGEEKARPAKESDGNKSAAGALNCYLREIELLACDLRTRCDVFGDDREEMYSNSIELSTSFLAHYRQQFIFNHPMHAVLHRHPCLRGIFQPISFQCVLPSTLLRFGCFFSIR